jgi:hypothetical protein
MSLYTGFVRYDGVELTNHARVKAYAEMMGLSFFVEQNPCDGLEETLGSVDGGYYAGPYVSPAVDAGALPPDRKHPWYDPNMPDTGDFAGFYLLEWTNSDSSTVARTVTEATTPGGFASSFRPKSREMVLRGVLLGSTPDGALAGLSWLKTLVNKGDACDVGGSQWLVQRTMDAFHTCPIPCVTAPGEPDCYTSQRHTFANVTVLEGVEVLSNWNQPKCGAVIEVQFTIVAQNPYLFGWPIYPLNGTVGTFDYQDLKDMFATYQAVLDDPSDTYQELSESLWNTQNPTIPGTSTPPPAEYDPACFTDPLCPTPPSFPTAPQTDMTCRTYHDGPWQRKTFPMEPALVSTWQEMVSTLYLDNVSAINHLSDIRVRFTPPGYLPDDGYSAEFYVTSLPTESKMILCGCMDTIDLICGGVRANAEHLVLGSAAYGYPSRWPVITCGGSWTLTVDIPDTETFDDLAVSLRLVSREA